MLAALAPVLGDMTQKRRSARIPDRGGTASHSSQGMPPVASPNVPGSARLPQNPRDLLDHVLITPAPVCVRHGRSPWPCTGIAVAGRLAGRAAIDVKPCLASQ